jgi:hypothetical protein
LYVVVLLAVYFRAYCDYKGWEQPTIGSLGEDGIPQQTVKTAAAGEKKETEDTQESVEK